ncbi:MAG: hypothetical protein AMXMBFR23_22680 [Chloroflexota bacterium]
MEKRISTRLRVGLPSVRAHVALVAALALALGACGSDGGIRITTGTGDATPTEAAPLATPTPRAVPLPPLPENPFGGGIAVAEYLAGGRADIAGCLPELVKEWGLAEEQEGPRCLPVDFDGDGKDEWLYVLNFPGRGDAVGLGDIWFFEDQEAGYRYFNSARGLANAATAGVQVREVRDLTRDGFDDVVITWQACEDSVCRTHLIVASQHNGTVLNLAPEASVESIAEFEVSEGGEIRMEGGAPASTTAGPARPKVVTVAWGGLQFRATTEAAAPVFLIHLVNDADALYARGDYLAARALYVDVTTDATLRDWKREAGQPAERTELVPYSYFRAALATLRAGDAAGMLTYLDRAVGGHEGSMHGAAASIYREAIRQGNTPEIACAATESYLGTFQALYTQFWDYGPTVPQRTVFTLCR